MRKLLSARNVILNVSSWSLLAACSAVTPPAAETDASGGVTNIAQGGSTGPSTGGTHQNSSTGVTSNVGGTEPGNGGAVQSNGGALQTSSHATGGNTTGISSTSAATSGGTTSGSAQSTGGATQTNSSTNRGGTTATGGSTSRGGATSSNCVDTPRSSESCTDAKNWGFCSQTWFAGNCQVTCGTCASGTGNGSSTALGGATSSGSAAGGATTSTTASTGSGVSVTPLKSGTQGKTTRYWDCCKPSCGWKANAQAGGKSSPATACSKDGSATVGADTQSVCSGGSAYQCNWGAPWEAGTNVAYGYAATSGNANCGKCYQLDFTGTGDNPGAQSLKGKSMIVQAINIGGDVFNGQFDLLIPGGGVGVNNACTGGNGQWGSANGGAQYGGFLTTCGNNMSCITDMCKAAFGSNSSLMAGCQWFVGWFAAANNPGIVYAEVPCPAELTSKSSLR